MATYGDFPGVRVTTESGGVPSISIGAEEKVLIFGEANYNASNEVSGTDTSKEADAEVPRQINSPREAEQIFGASELADAMTEALANGANIDYLYGVAVSEKAVSGETQSAQTGTLDNYNLNEDTDAITFDDGGTNLTVEFRYNGAPATPTDADTVYINPLTGDYAADAAPGTDFSVDYEYYDYASAFSAKQVGNVINEDETGIYWALTDSDAVSSDLNTVVSSLRNDYQLVNGFCFAEPNDSELLDSAQTTADNGGAHPLYNTSAYASANQSVTAESFYKVAPARVDDDPDKTIGGGLAGLYAGNPINDAVYNEVVSGYSSLQQSFSKTDADNMRAEDIIPVRSAGSVRVKGNRSTAYSQNSTVAAEFWTRRIADRVILIGKLAGDEILGRINDERTRNAARRVIEGEMQALVADRLIKPNTGNEQNWDVNVYEDSTNSNEVNIDIFFEPYGIAKRIDETITVNT